MSKISTIKLFLASLLIAAPAANAVIIDFEDFGTTNFQHGTVVNTQYSGVTISASNLGAGGTNSDGSGIPNLAVVFDSRLSPTRDPDLQDPFSGPLDSNFRPGNILIIQENDIGCADSICNRPDDEGTRPSGALIFEFDNPVELTSLDFFDIENFPTNDEDSGLTQMRFLDAADNELFSSVDIPGTGGDNTWDRLFFTGITGIRKLEVNLYGSGAIDRLEYSVVPLPASVWLFGSALIGFIGYSRRRMI